MRDETRVENLDQGLMALARWHGYRVYLADPADIHERMSRQDPGTFGAAQYSALCDFNVHEILISSSQAPWAANSALAHELGHVLAGSSVTQPTWTLGGRWEYFSDEVRGFEMALHIIEGYWHPDDVAKYAAREAGGLRNYEKQLFSGK